MTLDIIVQEKLIIDSVKLKNLSIVAYTTIKQLMTYKNPKFLENEKWGYSNFNTPKHLYSFQELNNKIMANRGCYTKIEDQLKKFGIYAKKIDRTLTCPTVDFSQSNIVLRANQAPLIDEMVKYETGVVHCFTSFGKTPSMLEYIKILAQPTLILVHTTFLMTQWINEITSSKLFNLSMKDIGGVGGVFSGSKRRYGKINVCLYHSLCKKEHLDFFKDRVGLLVHDECQKAPIGAVQEVVNNLRCKYKWGMTANSVRKDGLQFLTYDSFGPIRYTAIEKSGGSKILSNIKLIPTFYDDEQYIKDNNYTNLISRMAVNRGRNVLIARRAIQMVRQDKIILILVERKIQAFILAKLLSKFKVDMLLGPTNWKDYSLEHVEQKFWKKGSDVPKTNLLMLSHVTTDILNIVKNYSDKDSYDRINEKALYKKDIEIIIGTQKAEVGLNIRTIDNVMVTTPAGNNEERFNQMKGRCERTYSKEQEEYFGFKKSTPIVDVLVDYDIGISFRASEGIKEKYGKYVTKVKRTKR
jgi:superfamily II DNA or RNA helicase